MHQPAPAVHRATKAQRRRWTEAGEQHAICLPLSKLQLHQYHTCCNHFSVPAQTSCFSLSVWVWVTICGRKIYDCRNALIKPPYPPCNHFQCWGGNLPACLQGAATSTGVDQTKTRHASDSGRQDGWRKADSHTRHYDCVVRQASRGYARICQDQGVCISHAFAAKLRMLPLRLEQMTSRLQGNLHLAATNSKHRLAQGASLKTLPPSSVPVSLRPHLLPGPALILHSPSTLFLPCIIGMH